MPKDLRYIGERVAGVVHGGKYPIRDLSTHNLTYWLGIGKNGAFAQYVSAPAALVITLPQSLSFEKGAQLGVACYTAYQCLYGYLQVPTPFDSNNIPLSPQFILVWSGATSTGQYVIQLAKLGGLRVIATSSPNNFNLLRSLGTEMVFDYSDSFTYRRILEATQGTLRMAVDCYSAGMSPMQTSRSFGGNGGRIAVLLPIKSRIPTVETKFILAYSIFGKVVSNLFMSLCVLKTSKIF